MRNDEGSGSAASQTCRLSGNFQGGVNTPDVARHIEPTTSSFFHFLVSLCADFEIVAAICDRHWCM